MAFGIIFVVLGHKGGIGIFTDWFPYYSFHMPLFMFIAGYLFKEQYLENIVNYGIRKAKHLLLPYYVTNLAYGLLVTLFHIIDLVKFGSDVGLYSYFIMPFVNGHQYGLNVAMWFVPQLFAVQMLYVVLMKAKNMMTRKKVDYLMLLGMLALGIASVWCIRHGYLTNHFRIFAFRTLFFLPFFHIGWLYKAYWEKRDKLQSCVYFFIIFVVQFFLFYKYKSITFNAISNHYPAKILLPYISSITGILFWLRISKILEPCLIKFSYVRYLGANTWTVMAHHQFIFFLINLLIYLSLPFTHLKGFSVAEFQTNAWYGYHPNNFRFLLFYSIAGIVLPLMVKHIYEHKNDYLVKIQRLCVRDNDTR